MSNDEIDVNENDNTEEVVETAEESSTSEENRESQEEHMIPKSRLDKEIEKRKNLESLLKAQQFQTQAAVQEDGTIDPNAYKEQIKNEMRFEMQQQAQWGEALTKYPELANSTVLQKAVRGAIQDTLISEGQLLTPTEAAEQILGEISKSSEKAREKGRKEAQVSETIQERAGIDKVSTSQSKSKTLYEKFQSGELSKEEIKTNWDKILETM